MRWRNPCKKCIIKVMCERGCRSHYEHINTWFRVRNCFESIFNRDVLYGIVFTCLILACCLFIIFCMLTLLKGGTM